MFRIAIVEDNLLFQKRIARIIQYSDFLGTQPSIDIFASAEAFLNQHASKLYNIAILDIELPGMGGVALARTMQHQSPDVHIIFLTSYEHYMKDAFGLNVYKYIMKEDAEHELAPALKEIKLLQDTTHSKKISLRTYNEVVLLDEKRIILICFENRHPVVYTKSRKITVVGSTLKALYQRLNPSLFVQPNNGMIINVLHIESISTGSIKMSMHKDNVPISRGRYKEVSHVYTQHLLMGTSL